MACNAGNFPREPGVSFLQTLSGGLQKPGGASN